MDAEPPTTRIVSRKSRKLSEPVSTYVVSLCEELKRALPLSEGQTKPELVVGRSEILDIEDVINVSTKILGKDTCSWMLAYSTSIHEHSVSGILTRLESIRLGTDIDAPLLLLIKDKRKNVFGALLSSSEIHGSWEPYEIESGILIHLQPKFESFIGITERKCVVKCTPEMLWIRDHSGKCGIFLNQKLTEGKVEECSCVPESEIENHHHNTLCTYCSSTFEEHQFQVKSIECWLLGQ